MIRCEFPRIARRRLLYALILAFVAFAMIARPGRSDDTASVQAIPRNDSHTIEGLVWPFPQIEVEIQDQSTPDRRVIAHLKGRFNHPGWSLFFGDDPLLVETTDYAWREFEVPVELTGEKTSVTLTAGGPLVHEDETIVIVYSGYLSPHQARLEVGAATVEKPDSVPAPEQSPPKRQATVEPEFRSDSDVSESLSQSTPKTSADSANKSGYHEAIPVEEVSGPLVASPEVQIQVENEGTPQQRVLARLKGKFNHPEWTLLQGGRVILPPVSENQWRDFELPIEIRAAKTVVRFQGLTSFGELRAQSLTIDYPEFMAISHGVGEISSLGSSLIVGVGLTNLSYQETQLASLSEELITLKVAYQKPLSSTWDLGASFFWNALPVTTNQSGVTAEFFGANLRLGYALPVLSDPWTLSVAVGGYYLTMMTSGLSFGFRNMFGPQVFPSLHRRISNNDSLGTYIKYSPVSASGTLGFTSHELAAGLNYTHSLPHRHTISATLDYAEDEISLAGGAFQATAKSISLGVAYGF